MSWQPDRWNPRRSSEFLAQLETLEPRLTPVGTLSEQIIVDQFGWRADAASKVAIFADPISGQNAAIAYTPGSIFQVRRASDDGIAFSGAVAAWNGGATHADSGDKAWRGDFSALTTPGDYYIFDPTNNLRSYGFRLDSSLFNDILKVSSRAFYYQRSGFTKTVANAGPWNHTASHVGPGQELAAQLIVGSTPQGAGTARDVHGGWWDAGDYNKYVPFTTGVLWDLLSAYEWNPAAFADNWNLPNSGNNAPDFLDEIKWETDWLLRMQLPNGSVLNRVGQTSYDVGTGPTTDTQPHYYTAATTWATASFAASAAHASRIFMPFESVYPGYATALRNAAESAWSYLNANPNMSPASGTDGGNLAAAAGSADAGMDKRVRLLASAELWRLTSTAAYKAYFEANYNSAATAENGHQPIINNRFDPSVGMDVNRALVTYALTPGANTTIVNQIKTALRNMVDSNILPNYSASDPYMGFMWSGHYSWGSNQTKSQWANLLTYAIKLNVTPANLTAYRTAAEEYLHYFHGRNPLSWVYLSNMGPSGANLGGDKSPMQIYHSWFPDGSTLYDGPTSQYGPAPGYLVGGPNQYFTRNWIAPPYGEPAMKAFKDWNTVWNDAHQDTENPWEITEPAIYYQAAYVLLLSQYATAPADTTPPTVTGVYFDGSSWAAAFRTAAGSASGYPAQTGASQLTAMPWSTVNTVRIKFSENVAVDSTDLGVRGLNVANYAVSNFSYDNVNFVATWVLAANLDTDRIILDLDGASATGVADAAGNKLAGAWTESSSAFPTSGASGVNFKYRFVVAVGDANRDSLVRNSDVNLVRANLFVDAGQTGFSIFADMDGNGQTRNADLNAVRGHLFVDPPPGPGPNRPALGRLFVTGTSRAQFSTSRKIAAPPLTTEATRARRPCIKRSASAHADVLDAWFADEKMLV